MARRGQAPQPRSGAPKAQGLTVTHPAETQFNAVCHDLIGHCPTNRMPICTVEGWYNPIRRHSCVGCPSPIAYKERITMEIETL
jgi:hypothetical protein